MGVAVQTSRRDGSHPRPATAKTRSPSRQEQRRSRAVRGDLIPHQSSKAAASGRKRVDPHCRQVTVALDLGLLFQVRRRYGLESWMLKSNPPSGHGYDSLHIV